MLEVVVSQLLLLPPASHSSSLMCAPPSLTSCESSPHKMSSPPLPRRSSPLLLESPQIRSAFPSPKMMSSSAPPLNASSPFPPLLYCGQVASAEPAAPIAATVKARRREGEKALHDVYSHGHRPQTGDSGI